MVFFFFFYLHAPTFLTQPFSFIYYSSSSQAPTRDTVDLLDVVDLQA